ncbi:ubiquinone/menaquinone biosynthesis C-methylase UbiE [Chitinivorax tropicus]|uniref:Ubiquinone/menaquinone biosynthesis C-methylase UbiE n=1 Tax=Chitinivorax tropicus TaxID=714531 RepID=A0A840MJ16_9PROT|nr:class I SAM-dependent methyltransferase [Chitinivorax tropicus]MBB5019194.1 ubiquinone/menaquinone biosynthesis C-methylase UbiE [Chitinivorax tropicus]
MAPSIDPQPAPPSILLPLISHLPRHRDGQISVLDIGCGTGRYTTALAKRGFPVIGVDHSAAMLHAAYRHSPKLPWLRADVHALPLDDQSVDVTVSTLSSHYWRQHPVAYRELRRVTRERLVEFTSCREYVGQFWLGRYFPQAMQRTVERFPTLAQIRDTLRQAGFSRLDIHPWFVPRPAQIATPISGFLYSAKFQPARYLEDDFREAIGTFVNDITALELSQGLAALCKDLDDGSLMAQIESLPADQPDYLFLVAE